MTAPACVTVKVWPAIVSVPLREFAPVLAATLKLTVPLPEPLAPPLMVMNAALLVADQAQPLCVMMLTPPTFGLAVKLCSFGLSVKVRAGTDALRVRLSLPV